MPHHLMEIKIIQQNLLAMTCIDVASWRSWATYLTSVGSSYHLMLLVVTQTLTKCKTSEKKQSEKMRAKLINNPLGYLLLLTRTECEGKKCSHLQK